MRQWLQRLNEMAKTAIAQVGTELVHQASHGAHELAACINTGSAFVMYQRGSHDNPPKENGRTQDQIERDI